MGGQGSGRPPNAKTLVDRQLGRDVIHPVLPAGDDFIIPNLSGDHSAGRVDTTPTVDLDLVNKKYVDDNGDLHVLKAGDTMSGDLIIDNVNPSQFILASGPNNRVRFELVNNGAFIIRNATGTTLLSFSDIFGVAEIDLKTKKVKNVVDPTADQDASTKKYVDDNLHSAVTLAGTPDYITISGQVITRGTVDISDDTNLAVTSPVVLTKDTLSIDGAVLYNGATLQYGDAAALTGADVDRYMLIHGVRGSSTIGHLMMRSGSIIGVSWVGNNTSGSGGSGDFMAIQVKKNGTTVFTTGNVIMQNSGIKEKSATQATGVDTFVSGDVINAFMVGAIEETPFNCIDNVAMIEVKWD